VVGNNAYSGAARLHSCVKDARDMGAMLAERMGFRVKVETDVNRRQLREAVRWLLDEVRGGCIGVLYFSGHGCEQGGDNYLQPIGADVQRPEDVEEEYVKLNWILKCLNGAVSSATFCVFLDCCRHNETDMTWKSQLKGAVREGLTDAGLDLKSPTAAIGTKGASFAIGFASNPGSVALGNPRPGCNSPYTEALLRHLPTRRKDLALMYRDIAREVEEMTSGRQRPWLNAALPPGDFVL